MAALKYFFFFALAIAFVMATDTERVKKDVILGGAYPYAYSAGLYHGAAYVPTAYSAYSGYPASVYTSGSYPYGVRSIYY